MPKTGGIKPGGAVPSTLCPNTHLWLADSFSGQSYLSTYLGMGEGAHYHGHRTPVSVSNRGVRLPRFLGAHNLELSHLTLLKIRYGQVRVTGKLCTFSLENAPNVASMSVSGDSGQLSRGLSGAWGRKLCPERGELALLAQPDTHQSAP